MSKAVHDAWQDPQAAVSAVAMARYWTRHVRELQLDEERGVWDLSWSAAAEIEDPFRAGRLAWHRGDFPEAIERFEATLEQHGESEEILFWLAMAYLRQAEAENCLDHDEGHQHPADPEGLDASNTHPQQTHSQRTGHPQRIGPEGAQLSLGLGASQGGRCALPLVPHHLNIEPGRRATELFERLLDEFAPENRLYRWLLNLCHMTLGDFPDGVPKGYRIESRLVENFYGVPSAHLERRSAHLRFRDVAPELGVAVLNSGKGVAVEDFDLDGDLDLVTGGHYSQLHFFRNDAGGGFTDRTLEAGFEGVRGIHIVTAADYDGDGWMDLLVSRPNDRGKGSILLLRNQGDGSFLDLTASAGLRPEKAEVRVIPWAHAWGDVENDGDLDVFVATYAIGNPVGDGPTLPSRFFLNNGDGTFEDATERFGLESFVRHQAVFGAAFGDYDGDGYPDLALTHWDPGHGVLWRNVDGHTFTATDELMPPESGMMTAFLDVDHNGELDLFLGGSSGIAEAITAQAAFADGRGSPGDGGHTMLWRQLDGHFTQEGFFEDHLAIGTMGSGFGDLDNDGAFDFYLGTGNPEGWYLLPNLMLLGQTEGDRPTDQLLDISRQSGFGTLQKGHGIVFFDFDDDGDQDIYSSLGGMWPGDAWPNQLFANDSRLEASWIKLRLRGRRANRHGVGARIRVIARDADNGLIERFHWMSNGTGFGSSPYLAHIGLGGAVAVERVEVRWPGDRHVEVYPAALGQQQVLEQDSHPLLVPSSPEDRRPAPPTSQRGS